MTSLEWSVRYKKMFDLIKEGKCLTEEGRSEYQSLMDGMTLPEEWADPMHDYKSKSKVWNRLDKQQKKTIEDLGNRLYKDYAYDTL